MGSANNLSNTFIWNSGALTPMEQNKSNPILFAYLVATLSKTLAIENSNIQYSLASHSVVVIKSFSSFLYGLF
jgi:hypothetical protein